MKTKSYNPEFYYCYGTGPHGNAFHAKGCPRKRPLRWNSKTDYAYSVECAARLEPDLSPFTVRCVPVPGEMRIHR